MNTRLPCKSLAMACLLVLCASHSLRASEEITLNCSLEYGSPAWTRAVSRAAEGEDYEAMRGIFAFQRETDGVCATTYAAHVQEIFRKNPAFYITAADRFYRGDLSCPVWILINEASELDVRTIQHVLRSHAVKETTPSVKAFMKRVRRQARAIQQQTEKGYGGCR